MKILIIEDENSINDSIKQYLTASGYVCDTASDYHEALQKTDLFEYDCIILDIVLPGGNGLQLLQGLRTEQKADGVIIVSAKDDIEDKIKGIQLGADDYLTKPFHLSELAVRVEAVIRRKNLLTSNKITLGNTTIHTDTKDVTVNSKPVTISKTEYRLLLYFVLNKNVVLSKDNIVNYLWGQQEIPDRYDFMYTQIKNLRKILVATGSSNAIQSIYGMGYKLITKQE